MDGSRAFVDVMSYVTSVRKAFDAEPAKFEEFLRIFTDFRVYGLVDGDNILLRMEKLLKDHQQLLLGFVNFLPPYAKINIPPEATATCSLSYILSVKEAFRAQPANYDAFERLLRDYTTHIWEVDTFIANVELLMKHHENLLLGFINFLPKAQRTISSEAEQRVANFLGKLKGSDPQVFESFREVLEKFKQGGQALNEVHKEVVEILQGRDDLVMELSEFFSGRPLEIAKYITRLLQL